MTTDPITDTEIENIRTNLALAEDSDDPWDVVPNHRAVSGLLAEVDRLRAENTTLHAAVDQFNSFPTDPGPGVWSISYRMGYAAAGRDVHAITRALGLDQDGEGQA